MDKWVYIIAGVGIVLLILGIILLTQAFRKKGKLLVILTNGAIILCGLAWLGMAVYLSESLKEQRQTPNAMVVETVRHS